MRTQERKGNLLVILLQAVNLCGVTLHCGADSHNTDSNSKSINQVENRLQ
jgi:hypothetical protein